jgi:6-phosphofructokinase 2
VTNIVTLTMNPSIDVFTSADRIVPIHKVRCTPEQRNAGGGGINVARVARRMGGDVRAVYPTGPVIGQLLRRLVDEEGIESLTIPISGETREDFTAFDTQARHEYRFVLPGPLLSDGEWRKCLAAFETCAAQARLVVASGSLPRGAPDDLYARTAAMAKRAGAQFVVDASTRALKAALDEGVFLAKPNLRELQDYLGETLADRQTWIDACRRLVSMQRAEIVALTLGHRGALLVTRDRVWFAEPLPVEPQSTVGAGDSFLGAMIWALASGLGLEAAFRYGVAGGSAALMRPGTDLCLVQDVERLLPQVRLQTL